MNLLHSLLIAAAILLAGAARADIGAEIRDIYETLLINEDAHVLPAPILADSVVAEFYEQRDFEPAWRDLEQAQRVWELLRAADQEGLNPDDYHVEVLNKLIEEYRGQRRKSDRTVAKFDILLSDGLMLFARHLIEGKVDPSTMESTWNYTRRDFDPVSLARVVNEALAEGRIGDTLEGLKPSERFYRQMKEGLARYRALAAAGEFYPVPNEVVLRPGESHPNVVPLRKQLKLMEFLPSTASDGPLFDEPLRTAVEHFQHMHGIDVDGIVGAQSFAALNVPWQQRVDQLRINLDRLRWIWEDRSEEYVVVNIPGFELYYIRGDEMVWNTNVMTGSVRTQTPMFRSRMKYLELNPTWTVPRSILARNLYGKFEDDPSYIERLGYRLYDGNGARVDPGSLDWEQYSRRNFPFRVVQQPGPENAMGQVKFIFPNRHAIFLHDTPSRELFSRSARAFSAGCIRVQHPLELARVILNDDANWSAEQISRAVASGNSRVVNMTRPIDVMLMYWTAGPSNHGRVKLFNDVYNRDAEVLAALNAAPQW